MILLTASGKRITIQDNPQIEIVERVEYEEGQPSRLRFGWEVKDGSCEEGAVFSEGGSAHVGCRPGDGDQVDQAG